PINSILPSPTGHPEGLARDGNLYYFADASNNRIYSSVRGSAPVTVAGTGTQGFAGDGGKATSARLNGPVAVALDPSGNIYIADAGNCRVRQVDPLGNISTLAGNGRSEERRVGEEGEYGGEEGQSEKEQV